jgi:hypothetical protein
MPPSTYIEEKMNEIDIKTGKKNENVDVNSSGNLNYYKRQIYIENLKIFC